MDQEQVRFSEIEEGTNVGIADVFSIGLVALNHQMAPDIISKIIKF